MKNTVKPNQRIYLPESHAITIISSRLLNLHQIGKAPSDKAHCPFCGTRIKRNSVIGTYLRNKDVFGKNPCSFKVKHYICHSCLIKQIADAEQEINKVKSIIL